MQEKSETRKPQSRLSHSFLSTVSNRLPHEHTHQRPSTTILSKIPLSSLPCFLPRMVRKGWAYSNPLLHVTLFSPLSQALPTAPHRSVGVLLSPLFVLSKAGLDCGIFPITGERRTQQDDISAVSYLLAPATRPAGRISFFVLFLRRIEREKERFQADTTCVVRSICLVSYQESFDRDEQ